MTDLRLDPETHHLIGPLGRAHVTELEARIMAHLLAHPLGLTVVELVALTWPHDPPADAPTALRFNIHKLRLALAEVCADTTVTASHPASVYALTDADPN